MIAAHGMFGTAAITALTVQSTLGVKAVHPVSASILLAMLEFLAADMAPDGIKIGMLATEENVAAVAKFVARFPIPIVLDPVVLSSSGRELLSCAGLVALQKLLLPHVSWCTPNHQELTVLGGAQALRQTLPGLNLVVTGGDLESAEDVVLLSDGSEERMQGTKIESRATHGTGCAFSTALLCGLVAGLDGIAAARAAKEFVRQGIQRAEPIGGGHGPLNLLWPLRTE